MAIQAPSLIAIIQSSALLHTIIGTRGGWETSGSAGVRPEVRFQSFARCYVVTGECLNTSQVPWPSELAILTLERRRGDAGISSTFSRHNPLTTNSTTSPESEHASRFRTCRSQKGAVHSARFAPSRAGTRRTVRRCHEMTSADEPFTDQRTTNTRICDPPQTLGHETSSRGAI